MASAQQILDRAKTFGIDGKIWAKGEKIRIYAKTNRRDTTVYLDLEGDLDDICGHRLCVFIESSQPMAWIKSEKEIAKENFIALCHAATLEIGKKDSIGTMHEDALSFEKDYLSEQGE